MARAWTEWMGWLDDKVRRGWEVDDVLPGCPQHLWAAYSLGTPLLAISSVWKALGLVLEQIRIAIKSLPLSPVPDRGGILTRMGNAIRGSHGRLQATRDVIARDLPCPVCHRLALARDRIIALLFSLLMDPQHRVRFERGYGLCLRHYSRALALTPSPMVRAILTEIEFAKLSVLHWELEESLRKDAWSYRPEAAGTEHVAWRRAVLRFSGSFVGGIT